MAERTVGNGQKDKPTLGTQVESKQSSLLDRAKERARETTITRTTEKTTTEIKTEVKRLERERDNASLWTGVFVGASIIWGALNVMPLPPLTPPNDLIILRVAALVACAGSVWAFRGLYRIAEDAGNKIKELTNTK